MKKTTKIKIPATTANLGPGFDVLGAALKLYNEIEVTFQDNTACFSKKLEIEIKGEGAKCLPKDENNIVWQSMKKVINKISDIKEKKRILSGNFQIYMKNNIPLRSGLGSSAAAWLGGILAGNEITGGRLSAKDIIALGVKCEGHPDNIVPAFVGGLCISGIIKGCPEYIKLKAPQMKAVICNPDFELSTTQARNVLPQQLTLPAAVFNLSRLAFFMGSLQTKQYNLLAAGMEDKLHQPAREHLVPGMSKVLNTAIEKGAYGAALSGAGPSLIALCSADKAENVAASMVKKWKQYKISSRYFILDFESNGAKIN